MSTLPQVLTIATSDSGGGAGIQADIKSIHANGAYALSVIVAITAQNTKNINMIQPLSRDIIEAQIDSVFDDFEIRGLKTGMLYSSDIVSIISSKLKAHGITNLVVDPVMISKSGAVLLKPDGVEKLKSELLPLATVVTPNIPEANELSGLSIQTVDDVKEAAKRIYAFGCPNVLITGGHLSSEPATDLLYDGREYRIIPGEFIKTRNTHGTGCTFSAAIAAQLAKGECVIEATLAAKRYITGALKKSLSIGSGWGPLNHL